jgi:heme/copper-type cytochrome/quinol oxidase subunit 3
MCDDFFTASLSLMKDRQWLAISVGLFGVYLLVHAAVAGYGLYWANEALRPPVLNDGPFVPELREAYPALIATFVVLASLGTLSMTACMGFFRNCDWARPLWLMTGTMAVVFVAVAVVFLEVAWTHYLFEAAVIGLSCWYVWRLRKAAP